MKKLMILCLTLAMCATMMTACSQNGGSSEGGNSTQQEQTKQPELADVVQAVKDAYGENYLPSTPLDEQMLTDIYGLDMENVEEVIGEAPMISAHVDTFIAVKAKEGKGEAVEKELQEYLDYVVENSVNYPMNVAKVQAAKVVRHGDYVFYVMLGGYDDRTDVSGRRERKICTGTGADWCGCHRLLLLIRRFLIRAAKRLCFAAFLF